MTTYSSSVDKCCENCMDVPNPCCINPTYNVCVDLPPETNCKNISGARVCPKSPGPSPGPSPAPPAPPAPPGPAPPAPRSRCDGANCFRDENGQFPMKGPAGQTLHCKDMCPLCPTPYGSSVKTCTEFKNPPSGSKPTCSQLPNKDQYITQITSLGCTKDQAITQWNNFNSCLCGAAPTPPGKNPGKGLSVPVIIIISLAALLVVGILLYLLFRK